MYLRPRDLIVFEALDRHGPLPSHYLYCFQKNIAHDRIGFLKRLKKLTDEGFLERPLRLNNPLIHTDHKVYVLGAKAKTVLSAAGKAHQYAVSEDAQYAHAFMTSCTTASIELEAMRLGCRFVTRDEILKRAAVQPRDRPLSIKCKVSYTASNGSTLYSDRPVEPDQLFGIDYGGAYRFFALEADRGSEPIIRNNLDQSSILRKLLAYNDILARGEHRQRFGIPNLFPMFVTTSDARMESMIDLARNTCPKYSNFFLFRAIPGFEVYFRTPPLLTELFTTYRRVGDSFDISKR